MSMMFIEYPREAPPWARALRKDVRYLIRLNIAVLKALGHMQEELHHMDHNIDEVLSDVADESTQIDSLSALTSGLKSELDKILAGALPPDVQAKVNSLFDAVEANKAKVVTSINANTSAPAGDGSAPAAPPSAS